MSPEEISKTTLEDIIDSFQEAAILVDKDGRIIFANNTFAERVRKDSNEIIDSSIYDLFPPHVAEKKKFYIEQVINTKKSFSFEDERAGRHFIAHMTPIIDSSGNVDRVLIIAHDITDKKRLEKELINSKNQLVSILDTINAAIHISDIKTYRILYANEYAKRIFGKDMEGKLCYKVLRKSDKPCEYCGSEILLKQNIESYNWEWHDKDNKIYHAVTTKIIKWTDDSIVKISCGIDITDKKKIELALMEKEKTYRTILENLPIGFFRTTPDGTYVMANKALAEMYGYLSPEELINNVKDIGKEIFVNPEERSILIETLEKFGHIENFEAKRYRKDKTIIWTLTSARKVTDDCGKTIYYEGTTIDITHRRRLEDELFKEKEKFSILTENAPFATALIDKNGTYLYINKKFKEIFGYDLSDIPDRDAWFKKAYPDEDYRNKVVYSWKEDLETLGIGESTSKRFTVTCKDGSKKIVEIMPVILVSGLFLITYVDITEKENVEENYRSIFENATEGIAQTTLDGKVIIANPAFVKMLGYTSLEEILNEIKNIPAQIYVNPQDREKLLKLIKSYKNVKGFETQFYRKDGTTIWVSIDISGIYDEKGNITYLHSIVEDITDKKKKEEELTHLRQQYTHAQKMEALGTLTGGIAHDFNNFLTAIMGYANLAQLKISKDFHIKRYIDQIQNVAGNMADLVKNLLAFSRKQPTKLMPLDVNTEVKETKKLLKRLLTENIELSILPSDKNPIVMADKTQLNQILFNMATNARDAMPEGGRFTVRIDTTTMDKDFIKTHGFGKKGNYALMSISDTGIGIDKEIMDKIFDPFFTTKEPGYGTGLGLASVYGIVKQHKGYITVDSTPGSGTTFNIYLPLIDITPKEEPKQKFTLPKGTGTILIGEDDEDVRGFLKDILEYHGYKTITAKDGKELIDEFKNHKNINIVLTDFIMPKKSGADVYKEIRAIDEKIRFIFISGYDKDMLSMIPSSDKKVSFVPKPITVDTLLQSIWEMLKG